VPAPEGLKVSEVGSKAIGPVRSMRQAVPDPPVLTTVPSHSQGKSPRLPGSAREAPWVPPVGQTEVSLESTLDPARGGT
jgi:hypothetical protein